MIRRLKKSIKKDVEWRDRQTKRIRDLEVRGETKTRMYKTLVLGRSKMNKRIKRDRARLNRAETKVKEKR